MQPKSLLFREHISHYPEEVIFRGGIRVGIAKGIIDDDAIINNT